MAATIVVRACIDKHLKDEATGVLAEFGLTVSDVVRMMLARVVRDRAVPLELSTPSAETQAAIAESRRLMKSRNARYRSTKMIVAALKR